MTKRHLKKASGVVVAFGLMFGTVGAVASPAFAHAKKVKFTTNADATTTSLGEGGSFSVQMQGSAKGATSDDTFTGTTSQKGHKPITKSMVKGKATPNAATGGYSATVQGPYVRGTVDVSLSLPPGDQPPPSVGLVIHVECNWDRSTWRIWITSKWTSDL